MNLVTSGNAAIALSTCIVGLLLVLPKTNLRSIVRYSLFTARRTFAGGADAKVVDVDVDVIEDKPQVSIALFEADPSRTETDVHGDRVLEPVAG